MNKDVFRSNKTRKLSNWEFAGLTGLVWQHIKDEIWLDGKRITVPTHVLEAVQSRQTQLNQHKKFKPFQDADIEI